MALAALVVFQESFAIAPIVLSSNNHAPLKTTFETLPPLSSLASSQFSLYLHLWPSDPQEDRRRILRV
jgi:hypothetical protein